MYRRALEVDPEDITVMVRMAGALLAHGKGDAAITELKHACELECDVHGMAFNSLIKAYQHLGKVIMGRGAKLPAAYRLGYSRRSLLCACFARSLQLIASLLAHTTRH